MKLNNLILIKTQKLSICDICYTNFYLKYVKKYTDRTVLSHICTLQSCYLYLYFTHFLMIK